MKILNSISNFIWVFIVIGAIVVKVFVFPEKPTTTSRFSISRILDITFGDILTFALSIVVVILLVWLYLKLRVWHYRKRHPETADLNSNYLDEREALDAFFNPDDPVLNPQAPKPKG